MARVGRGLAARTGPPEWQVVLSGSMSGVLVHRLVLTPPLANAQGIPERQRGLGRVKPCLRETLGKPEQSNSFQAPSCLRGEPGAPPTHYRLLQTSPVPTAARLPAPWLDPALVQAPEMAVSTEMPPTQEASCSSK